MALPLVSGLDTPEGVALDGQGNLLVVEAGARRLVRINLLTKQKTVVATGLASQLIGVSLAPLPPLFNDTADVAMTPSGDILVTGDADGSIVRLRRLAACCPP